ncbi:hypothetical protein ACROYT_G034030 [Oculina patagonica]
MEQLQCDVDSTTTCWRTNFREQPSTSEKRRQQTAKHCNGFTPYFGSEDKRSISLCSSELEDPFAGTSTPECITQGTISPRNRSHCVTLFNGHGKNGCVGYETIPCNGFHKTEARETSPERTVGYGRPRSQSYPKRLHSWSGPSSENEDRFNHRGSQCKMSPEKLRHYNQMKMEMERKGFPIRKQDARNGVDHREISKLLETNLQFGRHPLCGVHLRSKEGITDRRIRSAVFLDNDTSAFHAKNIVSLKQKARVDNHRTSARSYLEGEVESNHKATACLNGWHAIPPFAQNLTFENEPKCLDLQQSILNVLEMHGAMETLDIVNAVGPGSSDEVNQSLCSLYRHGLVTVASDGSHTAWTLAGQPAFDNRASPGVIGGERSNDKSSGRNNYEEFCVQPRRHSSGGSYDIRPRKELRAVDGMKPWMRSNGNGPTPGERSAGNYCKLCRISLVSETQYEEHLRSTKHQNKVAKFSAIPYKKFCEYCKVHLNSESQAKEHFSSGRHEQTVAKSQKAPPQQHLPLTTVPEQFTLQLSTSTQPYGYQLELYSKAMKTNAVCFLPTGTGKTLVASLVIAHMLKLNPSRQVVFLVDRVLLVLQQSNYLRKELAHVRVADERDAFKGTRPIRIGAVCGEMRKLEGNARIYEQDVLIITADCYRNHLNNGTLRFDDVSLIVLDEAHHCNKDHPYNVIIRDFYLREDVLLGHRPKILGLTASPAGEISLDKTTKRLQRLLGNLGEAQLLVVTKHVQELEEKTNRAPPECISASYTTSERQLMEVLVEYVTKAFNMAVRLSEMKDYKDIFQPSSGGHFSIDDICPVLRVIDNILLSRPESNALYSLLHFQQICEAVCTLQECGEQTAIYQIAELADEKCPHGFHWAESVGLPCIKVRSYLEHYLRKGGVSEFRVLDSGVEQLVKQLLKINWTGANVRLNCLVLVLVKRARTARSNTTDEREVQIREGMFQIVVTTSVAEEGLDLPVPSLLIQMDPSSSVSALVQIRGQAPLNEARFVAICRSDEQANKIEDLLKREENMKRSARLLNGFQTNCEF